jgi:hypothetical protein
MRYSKRNLFRSLLKIEKKIRFTALNLEYRLLQHVEQLLRYKLI